jgi:hypothetical protein
MTTLETSLAALEQALTDALPLIAKKAEVASAIANLQTAINTLKGQIFYIPAHNFENEAPSDLELTTYSQTRVDSVITGITVVNQFDNNEWYFNGEHWVNLGQATVNQATNTSLGIVKGSSVAYKASVDADGTLIINNLTPKLNEQDAEIAAIADTIDNVNGLLDDFINGE